MTICAGMERSGSTVAWQIVKHLTGVSPTKTHTYTPGDAPVLYTFRHPKEAYLSLRRCFEQIYPTSIAVDYAEERICMQLSVFSRLQKDFAEQNRNVLFLRYEDFYFREEERIKMIAGWLGLEVKERHLREIAKKTSVQLNKAVAGTTTNFGDFDETTGLHGKHINPTTNGCPGMLISTISNAQDVFLKSQKMIDMCVHFGYDPNNVVVK